jgi:organic radical activating enzyme
MATKNILAVSEVFYSIQGEGQTMGIPAVFLRLGGCNLLCESKSWVCDTIEVWRKSKATTFENVLTEEQLERLKKGAHLVITGGEPMMHQKKIETYLSWFMSTYQFLPIIEIETNGTISAEWYLSFNVDFWNVSPKLSSAGEQNTFAMRINHNALKQFISFGQKTIFKFVVESQKDIDEILEIFNHAQFEKTPLKQIVLMPAGCSQEELYDTRLFVAEKCREYGFRYSDRLHVVIWNQKTGV